MYLRRIVVSCSLVFLSRVPMASGMPARVLTFEDRVGAQEAIEKVYYSHQLGVPLPFEEAVPKSLLEAKVRSYLRQTIILESYWNVTVNSRMLERETERIERDTRMPGRLADIYRALGNDPFLIQECLARPALVERMVRNFYDFDERLHAASRAQAEILRQELLASVSDGSGPAAPGHPIDIRIGPDSESENGTEIQPEGQVARLNVPFERFQEIRNGAPDSVGTIGPIVEERDRFVIRSVVSEDAQGFRLMTYAVEKERWEDWWAAVGAGLDELSVQPVASVGYQVHPPLDESQAEQCTPDTWTNQSLGSIPDPRVGFTAVWTGSLMVVWGGAMGTTALNTGGRYDPATDSWSATSLVNAPMPRTAHSAVWTGHEMVVWGGSTGIPEAFYTNTGARYDPVGDVWTPISTSGAPVGRNGHGAAWTGTEMLVWGGGSNFNGGRYNPATDTWRTIVTPSWMFFRQRPSLIWTGRQLIAWSGSTGNYPYPNTGGAYDPVSDTWKPTSTVNAPSGRIEHAAVWTGSRMVVWGGYDGVSNLQSGGRYDPLTDTWTSMTTLNAPAARNDITAVVWTGREMVIWGGYNGSPLRTGGRYDPVADVWSATSLINAPAARFEPQAVWTGDLMIAWGGAPEATGGRYDPATDSWTPTSVMGAPEPRALHTAVWTGSQMVIWGGNGESPAFNSGRRYDPALDLWKPTSLSNAPLARFSHTSVWTGTEMIIWGGRLSFGQEDNTGGRYNPMTDSWVPVATAGAPAKRWAHTAVWTGHLMVVFGGTNSRGGEFGTGGRYDPLLDTWTPTRSADFGRYYHSAVWTGKLMLVFGGRTFSYILADGRGYDPVTDQWSYLYAFNAPINRYLHQAAWTGSRMLIWGGNPCLGGCSGYGSIGGGSYDPAADRWDHIADEGAPRGGSFSASVWTGKEFLVWGGQDGVGLHNDGARYDPVSRTWRSMPQAGAPSERQGHTAVWTGNAMLVWGGVGYYMLASGGLYCACPGPVTNWYQDADGDGYGDPAISMQSCESPAGFVPNAGDCDDNDSGVHPGAAELCNGRDDNCNGSIDEGLGIGDTCTQAVDECHVLEGVMRCQNDGSARCEGTSRFNDVTPPDIICPKAVEAECPSQPDLGVANATDGCDPTPTMKSDAPATLPLGATTVTWSATDASGNTASCDQIVRIVDTQPPTLMVTTDVHTLWPPNHEMVPVNVSWQVQDACDPNPGVALIAASSSEPDDSPGVADGDTVGDIAQPDPGTLNDTLLLRAERDGSGPGRVYTLTYAATDHSGNGTTAIETVVVPHDLGHGPEPLLMRLESDGSGGLRIYWPAMDDVSGYDVISGDLSQMAVANHVLWLGSVKVLVREADVTSFSEDPGRIPPQGQGFFYLIQPRTSQGGLGYGTESAPWPRIPSACDGGCP